MLVRLMGFSIKLPKNMEMVSFWEYVNRKAPPKFEGFERFFMGSMADGLLIGVMLTTKDHRKFVETKNEGGKHKVVKRETTAGNDGTEFNFIAINPVNGRGLISVYQSSMSLSSWGRFLAKLCDAYQRELIEAEIPDDLSDEDEKKATRAAEKKYNGFYVFKEKVAKCDIEKILSQVEAISRIECPIEWSDTAVSDDVILKSSAPDINKTFVFDRRTFPYSFVRPLVSGWAKARGSTKGVRILALTESAGMRWFEIGENLQYFGSMDFDEHVDDLPDEWEKYASSDVLEWLVTQMYLHRRAFGLA